LKAEKGRSFGFCVVLGIEFQGRALVNEVMDSIKDGEFVEQLSSYQRLKNCASLKITSMFYLRVPPRCK
jgi:hypothetical protein